MCPWINTIIRMPISKVFAKQVLRTVVAACVWWLRNEWEWELILLLGDYLVSPQTWTKCWYNIFETVYFWFFDFLLSGQRVYEDALRLITRLNLGWDGSVWICHREAWPRGAFWWVCTVVLSNVAGMCDYYYGVESHNRPEQSGGTATTANPCIEFYSRAQSYCAFRRDDFCGSTAKSQLTLIPTRVYSSCD